VILAVQVLEEFPADALVFTEKHPSSVMDGYAVNVFEGR